MIDNNVGFTTTRTSDYVITTERGAEFQFDIKFEDTGDPITITDNVIAALPGTASSTATANGAGDTITVTIRWTVPSNIRLSEHNVITIQAEDNVCQIKGNNSVSIDIIVPDIGPMYGDVTVVDPSCNGESDGSVSVVAIRGGIGPYTYVWSVSGSTTNSVTGIAAGGLVLSAEDLGNPDPSLVFGILHLQFQNPRLFLSE